MLILKCEVTGSCHGIFTLHVLWAFEHYWGLLQAPHDTMPHHLTRSAANDWKLSTT
jgi:hypothetical protein